MFVADCEGISDGWRKDGERRQCFHNSWCHYLRSVASQKPAGCHRFQRVSHLITPPPMGSAEYCDERVCLTVCLSVHYHISGTACPMFTKFLVHVTSDRGSVLPWRRNDVLRKLISGFVDDVMLAHKLTGCSTSPPGWGSEAQTQPWAWRVGIPVAGSGRSVPLLAVSAYWAAVGVLNIYDIMLARNVRSYTATRKWHVLKVTPPQVHVQFRRYDSGQHICGLWLPC